MKIFLQNIINKITPCFTMNNLDSLDQINRGINNNSYLRTSINLDILPSLPKIGGSTIEQPSPINSLTNSLKKEFFLNDIPSTLGDETYKNILNNFINHHGKDSLKIKELIPEQDIADRVYNIHTITGNNTNPFLLKHLKEMYSNRSASELVTLNDKELDISSITPTCGHSVSSNASSITVELSPGGDTLDITSLPDIVSYASTIFGG